MDFGQRYGLTLELCRQPSWAAVRDKLLSGELDAAHSLYGLVYGVQLGLGGPQADMAILMTLNRNGQAIAVSNRLACGAGRRTTAWIPPSLPLDANRYLRKLFRPVRTRCGSIIGWLRKTCIRCMTSRKSTAIPPPQMTGRAGAGGVGWFLCRRTLAWHWPRPGRLAAPSLGSGAIWPNHPAERHWPVGASSAALYPNTARALICTVLEACKWLENPARQS